ncbi:MAG: endolytic transglycosylase MltG [Candidatus Kaiserbacteria bacterium]|nr:endolytic transglycosylase MltG [Candidatus Kaiserbacteria bacterium]
MRWKGKRLVVVLVFIVLFGVAVLSLPTILVLTIQHEQAATMTLGQFPVTVDPKNKIIVENAQVNAIFETARPPLQAAVENTGGALRSVFEWIATTVSEASWYQSIAGVAGASNRIITITPGMRKEQAASAFGNALAWNSTQKKQFMVADKYAVLPLPEGSFSPGVYVVEKGTTPAVAQDMVNQRFAEDILSRYGTTTAQIVPLNDALTIASLLEREASGPDDMRLISGIIWNRLFANMNLQIDATVQYAKANGRTTGSWWPKATPADISRKSPYNTYIHSGLPPTPIANPSVAAVLAALNPKSTTCLFYFHDNAGQFHCSNTYAEHVVLLKKYFGRGK